MILQQLQAVCRSHPQESTAVYPVTLSVVCIRPYRAYDRSAGALQISLGRCDAINSTLLLTFSQGFLSDECEALRVDVFNFHVSTQITDHMISVNPVCTFTSTFSPGIPSDKALIKSVFKFHQ